MRRVFLITIVVVASISILGYAQEKFPRWHGSNVLLYGDWLASPVVAVGVVKNVRTYGEQTVDHLPWPMAPWVRKLYWCEGDFQVIAVVKGELSAGPGKYLWGSGAPGCKLWDDNPNLLPARMKTRAWFLREEDGVLRPTFDGGTYKFIEVMEDWGDAVSSPRHRLGELLLTPSANTDTLEDYARYLGDVGDIACDLLGRDECARRIRSLASLGNPSLRKQACAFLQGELGRPCE
jgi:hypothetical protein